METLVKTVKETLDWYVSDGFGSRTYSIYNEEHHLYAVVAVDYPIHKRDPMIVVMARIAGDTVIVEEDRTDRSLVNKLIENGVPPEKVIRPGIGDPLPDANPELNEA